jgi:hypothetical protein
MNNHPRSSTESFNWEHTVKEGGIRQTMASFWTIKTEKALFTNHQILSEGTARCAMLPHNVP